MSEQTSTFHNLVLVEGLPEDVKCVVDSLMTHFPGAVTEGQEETQRHRDWFAKEVAGFRQPVAAGHMNSAYCFQSEGGAPPTFLPTYIDLVAEAMDRYKDRVIIGYAALECPKDGSAVALAKSTDSAGGIVGSLGGNRYNYFVVMKHLLYNDDAAAWFRDFTTNKAIGPIPYCHRRQWSESTSPLRLVFETEDPARDGWGLTQGSDSTERTFITEKRFSSGRRRIYECTRQLGDDDQITPACKRLRNIPIRRSRRSAHDVRLRTPCRSSH